MTPVTVATPAGPDRLVIGRNIRHARIAHGWSVNQLAHAIGRAASGVSAIENGRRGLSLELLAAIAAALEVEPAALLSAQVATARDALEIEWERAQRGSLLAGLKLPPLRPSKAMPRATLENLVGLHRALQEQLAEAQATPEEARRANAALRAQMRRRGNHFAELEDQADQLLGLIDHRGGPLSVETVVELAAKLGYSLHYVADLPHSTRSVTDTRQRRIYLDRSGRLGDPRSALLQALSGQVLGHGEPGDYATFLLQRVQTNYLSAALLIPRQVAVTMLRSAMQQRQLDMGQFRDAFAVSDEVAAHRFTNLATRYLDLRVHFLKIHESGVVHKAYENDGLPLPADQLGAIEGQTGCRFWAGRTVFADPAAPNPYVQYTDTPVGTFWCSAQVRTSRRDGRFAIVVGATLDDAKWFAGRDAKARRTSRCPDPACCRLPPADLAERWSDAAFPAALTHASVLAAMPSGAYPGVDTTEVYAFLDRHAGGAGVA